MFELLFWMALSIYLFSRLWGALGARAHSHGQQQTVTIQVTPESVQPKPEMVHATDDRFPDVCVALQKWVPNFNWSYFLQGAESAFRQIVTQFQQGRLEPIAHLLNPTVMRLFEMDVQERQKQGIWHQIEIESVQAELIDAKLQDQEAIARVRFLSDQKILPYDSGGRLMNNLNQLTNRFVDIWHFRKNLQEKTSNWLLVAVHADDTVG